MFSDQPHKRVDEYVCSPGIIAPQRVAPLGLAFMVLLWAGVAGARVLPVGPGRTFDSIARAVAAARPGDVIRVWPLARGAAYRRVAIQMHKPRITIEAAVRGKPVRIDGTGFDYSGRGPIPRAIFQFDPDANDCTLRGLDLYGAHNNSFNGAGVRINGANNITITHCYIHNNDMGIMSNGDLTHKTGAHQLIEFCHITRNGNMKQAGYNHNLYLGGTSALIRCCNISHSLTGHNIKSRCHITWIEYCYVHDSANREIDLVDDPTNTRAPHSDAVVLGCLIVKNPNCPGNHEVIHFGQDGNGPHNGTLFLIHNTIQTPYPTPVVLLSAAGAHLVCLDNKILGAHGNARFFMTTSGANPQHVTGRGNQFSAGFGAAVRTMGGPLVDWSRIWRRLPSHAFAIRSHYLEFWNRGRLKRWGHPTAGAGYLR